MSGPRVRACVVSYRSGARAVAACRSALDAGAEVVVCDNDPGDGTAALLAAELPDVVVRSTGRNAGFAAGSNLAAEGAQTDYLLFLNPDAELTPGALEELVAHADAHPEAGVLGPALIGPAGRPQPSVRADPTGRAVLHQYTAFRYLGLFRRAYRAYRSPPGGDSGPGPGPREVEVVMGSVLLVPRLLFEELGGFDPRYFMYYEEADLCRRVRALGRRVVHLPGPVVRHEGGASERLAPVSLAARRLVSAQRYLKRFQSRGRHALFRTAFLPAFALGAMADLLRDTGYLLAYSLWPPKHDKVAVKAREALSSLRLLTVDLFRVAAA